MENNSYDKYNLSGIYHLQCADCPLKYVGQTGRTFKTRFKEHIRDLKNGGQNSKFAQHILDKTHEVGTIDHTLKILLLGKKGRALDTYEKLYIYNQQAKFTTE
jgi:hypothetical protein